jgi:copper(I)-binding protein
MTTSRHFLTFAALASMALAGGCSRIEDPQAIPGDQEEPFQESVMGTNAELGAILLRSVHVEAPSDPDYDPGDDPVVWFTLLNEGRAPDTLVALSSPAAANAQIRRDDDCDGNAEAVPELMLPPVDPRPNSSVNGAAPFDAYFGRLIDLNRQVYAGTTIPVTFAFKKAGSITVDAFVQPSTAPRPAPTGLCPGPSATASPYG